MTTVTEVIRVPQAGGPDILQMTQVPMPVPQPGEILIEMEAAGVAFADLILREGRYPGVSLPAIPGYDVIGRVRALGDGVEDFAVGDRVGALTVQGSYARHRTVPASWAVRAPDALDAGLLVAVILNYTTAFQMLHRCVPLEAGDWILVHGGAGGVGQALLQLAAHYRLRAIATASTAKQAVLETLGAMAIDYTQEDFVARVAAITDGAGVTAAFDHMGGHHMRRSYEALGPSGAVISYGAMDVFPSGRFSLWSGLRQVLFQPRFTPLDLLADNRGVMGFDIAGRRAAQPTRFNDDLHTLFTLLEDGVLAPEIHDRLPLARAADAHERLAAGRLTGKLVLLNH